ncbi:MAG: hypothetical protein COX17_08545 [Deltaproteobacteria bacterium CG23_combo_of_CG06-09_8_20_14_all_60_8]|nr:MAG: hypothetical protein COX17_08545 [Deltaproteobacteria bacterium CG23_combo_of_CG06-09_8_20_14_all_60_8]
MKIRLYSLSTCVHCRATKRLLDQCTVKYDFTDVDSLAGEERQAVCNRCVVGILNFARNLHKFLVLCCETISSGLGPYLSQSLW